MQTRRSSRDSIHSKLTAHPSPYGLSRMSYGEGSGDLGEGSVDLSTILQSRSPIGRHLSLKRIPANKQQAEAHTGLITRAIDDVRAGALKIAQEEGWVDAETAAALRKQLAEKDSRIAELEAAAGYDVFTSKKAALAKYGAAPPRSPPGPTPPSSSPSAPIPMGAERGRSRCSGKKKT